MKLTDRLLKKLVMEQINEGGDDKEQVAKTGTATADVSGNVDFKPVADAVGIDPNGLKAAITRVIKKIDRAPNDNKIFGDLVIGLIKAGAANRKDVLSNALRLFLKFKPEN